MAAGTIRAYFKRSFLDCVKADNDEFYLSHYYGAHSSRHAVDSALRDYGVPLHEIAAHAGHSVQSVQGHLPEARSSLLGDSLRVYWPPSGAGDEATDPACSLVFYGAAKARSVRLRSVMCRSRLQRRSCVVKRGFRASYTKLMY